MCPELRPRSLVLALGKDGNAYLVDRNDLGGITAPVGQANVFAGGNRGTSAVTYRTNEGTYFAFHNDAGGPIAAYRITETNPPLIVGAWRLSQSGRGSPWVTTPDGRRNSIVWVVGAQGDERLHGYDADTGEVIYAGGGADELMSGTRQWNTGIAARWRMYFAADNKVYAFKLPIATPTATRQLRQKGLQPRRQRQRRDRHGPRSLNQGRGRVQLRSAFSPDALLNQAGLRQAPQDLNPFRDKLSPDLVHADEDGRVFGWTNRDPAAES
jgi:hypothetical protein